jgi:hypothetical protein
VKVIKLKLNMPPSVNEYFSITKTRKRVISKKGKKYKSYVMKQVTLLLKPDQLFTEKVIDLKCLCTNTLKSITGMLITSSNAYWIA